jgi:hypothetical protein
MPTNYQAPSGKNSKRINFLRKKDTWAFKNERIKEHKTLQIQKIEPL